MSNNVVKNGVAIKNPLFGPSGEIKKVNTVVPLPQSAASLVQEFEDIRLDELISIGNRDTNVKDIKKVLTNGGGINGNLWQPPRVARVQGCPRPILYDGDHSRAIYVATNPAATTIPCRVVHLKSKSEVHHLFVQANARCRTSINAETVFVNKVLAGEADDIYNASLLKAAGLYVYCSSELEGKQGDLSPAGQRIKIGGALRCFERSGRTTSEVKKYVRPAVKTISGMNNYSRVKRIPAELLEALTMVYVEYPDFMPGGTLGKSFSDWFFDASKRRKVAEFGSDLKKQGGNVVNAAAHSTAKGMIQELQKDPLFANIVQKF